MTKKKERDKKSRDERRKITKNDQESSDLNSILEKEDNQNLRGEKRKKKKKKDKSEINPS
ncbi:MAG: hypothetical protein ACQEQI_00010 [Bacillota bacterium]